EDARSEGDALVAALSRFAPEARHVVDTLPDNVLFLGLVGLIVPRARIVYCVRDPLDTCVAGYFSKYPIGAQPYSYDLTELGAYCRLYGELMDHWKAVLPNPFLEVRFEDLAERRPETLREILAFCGIEDDGPLPEIAPPPLLARFSVENYADHLAPLHDALGSAI
ncbi:MAG: sulfotransferase, partial [Phycisphaerales bacterium]|nr:sulfotransferase [Phycisphaerales bacterium]